MKNLAWTLNWSNFFDIEEPLAKQAFEQDSQYRRYELWRSSLRTQIKLILRAIKFPLGISPAKLRDLLLQQQIDLKTNIVSPLNYYFYLQNLEHNLEMRYQLLKGYRYAFAESRARLLEKLKENSEVTLNYFYQDVINHIVRLSTVGSIPKILSVLSFYQPFISEEIYRSVYKSVQRFSLLNKKLSNLAYKRQIQEIDKIFYPSISKTSSISATLINGIHYLWQNPISVFVPFAVTALSYQYHQSLFFHSVNFFAGAMTCYAARYTSSFEHSNVGLMAGFASLLPVVRAQTNDTFIELFSMKSDSNWMAAGATTLVNSDGSLFMIGYFTPNSETEAVSEIVSATFSANGAFLGDGIFAGAYVNCAIYNAIKTTDNGSVLIGYVEDQEREDNTLLIKLTENQTIEWSYQINYGGPSGAITSSLDDAFVILLTATTPVIPIKFSNNGTILWEALEAPSTSENFGLSYITLSEDKNLFTANLYLNFTVSNTEGFLCITKFNNTNGTVIWSALTPDFMTDSLGAITPTKDGGVVTSGVTKFDANDGQLWLAKFSSIGTFIWGKTLQQKNQIYEVHDAVTTSDNNIVLLASFYSTDGIDKTVLLFKVDSNNGTLLWSNSLTLSNDELIGTGSLTAANDSSLIMTLPIGESVSPELFNSKFLLAKLFSNGTTLDCNEFQPIEISLESLTMEILFSDIREIEPYFSYANVTFSFYENDTLTSAVTSYCLSNSGKNSKLTDV